MEQLSLNTALLLPTGEIGTLGATQEYLDEINQGNNNNKQETNKQTKWGAEAAGRDQPATCYDTGLRRYM